MLNVAFLSHVRALPFDLFLQLCLEAIGSPGWGDATATRHREERRIGTE